MIPKLSLSSRVFSEFGLHPSKIKLSYLMLIVLRNSRFILLQQRSAWILIWLMHIRQTPNKSSVRSLKVVMANLLTVLLLIEVFAYGFIYGVDGLDMNYYFMSCPFVEPVVRNIVNRALFNDPTLAAALIRMHFHDCFIEGCDGSVLIESTKDNTAEKDSPGNANLRGFEVIDDIKEVLERQCPGVVSCADIVAMAARDAVFFAGGPVYDIPKGRKDGRRSKIEDTINLPFPTFNASELIRSFGQRGFSAQEMVALSGAHTLGVARCATFKNRLSQVDPSLDTEFAKTLARTCSSGDNALQPLDYTSNYFDNVYFNALLRRNGVLTSDQTLYTSPQTRNFVNAYAFNQAMFFFDFQQAMVKMGLLHVKDNSNGEVRQNCRKIN
ncbi:Peroxidase 47, partial [Mucuna pruriens]